MHHELAIHKGLNDDAAECCRLWSNGMWYLTAEWSGDPSGDLSGDLVAVRAARKGTSGEQVTESTKQMGRKWWKNENRAQDCNNKSLSFPRLKQQFTKEFLSPLTPPQQAPSTHSYPSKPWWQNKLIPLLPDQKGNRNLTLTSLTITLMAHSKEIPHQSSMEIDPRAGPS